MSDATRPTTTRLTALHTAPPARAALVASLGAVGLVSAAAVAGAAPAVASGAERPRPTVSTFRGPLVDLQPATAGAFDGATARLVMVRQRSASTFVLVLSGVAPQAAGHTFGAHVHTGQCVAGNGAAAGLHYNSSTAAGVTPPVISDRTEVWLDVTIRPDLGAVAVARVPFVIPPGNRSVVLHERATDDHGTAGARQACLPVSWS